MTGFFFEGMIVVRLIFDFILIFMFLSYRELCFHIFTIFSIVIKIIFTFFYESAKI